MPIERLDQSTNEESKDDISHRELGAKILNQANFRARNQNIVDSSFEKARSNDEKLIGKNDERRADAYLERLSRGIEKYGSKYENRLWELTKNSLVIDYEDIPESYWKTQEQILRDDGQGRELSDYEKAELTKDIQEKQISSLESWTNYLSHEDCPYPTWFKVYTIDGVSKMGVFDKGKNVYRKRDKDSVAPYPHFNAAVLGKVYSAIADFYDINTDKDLAQTEPNNPEDEAAIRRKAELDALVKSGNFNKLYSKLLLSGKVIMKTPERTEDIHGEWVEYNLGDEEQLAEAADGTPWCIASSAVGRKYLTTRRYGESYNEDGENNRARFILFHLYDGDGRLVDNACASVRLDTDGRVAEISGLNDGQALEDSLVPIVEEKVRSLPGGEKFLKRFADKNRLIAIDRKIQSGADISKDDFRFIWELDRPIESLDTYNSTDPRIKEFREKFGADYAREKGYIIPDTTIDDIKGNLVKYLQNDLSLSSNLLTYILKQKQQAGQELDNLFSRLNLEPDKISEIMERVKNLETLREDHGIYLLPKDKWNKDKRSIPNPNNDPNTPAYIASQDLEIIILKPFGQYTEEWVGKLGKHHTFNDLENDKVNEWTKQFGFHIPTKDEWVATVNSLTAKLAKERGVDPSDISDAERSLALREDLGLAFSGYFREGDLEGAGSYGYFWSASEHLADHAYCLSFNKINIIPKDRDNLGDALSVRCVA